MKRIVLSVIIALVLLIGLVTPVLAAAPSVTTNAATAKNSTTATLQGNLTSLGGASYALVYFEYGFTVAYGTTTTQQQMTAIGSFTQNITGLRYNTTYHFRAVAVNVDGTTNGSDANFTTLPAPGSSTTFSLISCKVFGSVFEANDLLFTIEAINYYTGYYPNAKAGDYFHFQLLDTDNSTILAANPMANWGDRPGSIYCNADVASGLSELSAYYIKLIGVNIGGTPSTSYQLATSDWKVNSLDRLDDWCIGTCYNMAESDGVEVTDYVTNTVSGGRQISDKAGAYFVTGIPGITDARPNLFVSTQQSINFDYGTANNTLDSETMWETYVGSTISEDTGIMGAPFGITGKDFLAGLIIMAMLGCSAFVVMGTGGMGALGAVLISIPLLWLGTYFKIVPTMAIVIIIIIFSIFAIRQFVVKTL